MSVLPVFSLALLIVIGFVIIKFQTTNVVELMKDYTLKKNLSRLHDNIRDVLHSEKNVVFSMKILAQAALENYGTDEGLRKLERLAELSGSHLKSLTQSINNIRDFRIKTIKRDFIEAVDAALKLFPMPPAIRLVMDYRVDAAPCQYDFYHMTQVIVNLLENAADSLRDAENPAITLKLDASDYLILFAVEDNGAGISKRNLKKIQKPYFSTKSKQLNWGVGLSYVQRVVKAHFGYLSIKSKEGSWTRVELLLAKG
jgi:signal transduction histidine kinase